MYEKGRAWASPLLGVTNRKKKTRKLGRARSQLHGCVCLDPHVTVNVDSIRSHLSNDSLLYNEIKEVAGTTSEM